MRLGALSLHVKCLGSIDLHAISQFKRLDSRRQPSVVEMCLAVQFIQLFQRVKLLPLVRQRQLAIRKIGDRLLEIRNQRSLVGRRKKARTPQRCALGRLRWTDDDKARQILVFGSQAINQPRSHAGAGEGLFAGVHLQAGAIVVDIIGDHRCTTQMSSMHEPILGKSSLTSMPACPRFSNLKGEASILPVFVRDELWHFEGQRLAVVRRQLRLRIEKINV